MDFIRRTKQMVAFLLTLVVIACSKNSNTMLPPPSPIDTTAQVQQAGVFSSGPYGTVTGRVEVYQQNDAYVLALKNFTTSAGPDLHVYLSQEVQPIHFIDLGKLRQNSGDQLYTINGKPDFTQYKYALIHCQQFNHLFGSAPLK
ncbi:MAG: DM13 domain-containing protein [Flavisolibacter sp.]|nr:DM13 domain-containing protein [Flavisolibacter sp.]